MRFILILSVLSTFAIISYAQQKDELKSLLDTLSQVEEGTVAKVDVLNQIAWEYRNSNPRIGINYAKQALEIAREIGYDKGIGKSLSFLGVNHKNLGEHSQALEYFLQCASYSQKVTDTEAEGHSYNNMGEIFRLQKKYEQAEKNFQMALEAGQRIQNDVLIAYAHNSFGKLYKDLKNYDKALEEHQAALAIRKRLKDKKAVAASIENISKVYEAQGKTEEAINSYNQAFEFAKGFNDSRGMATALIGIARIQLKTEKFNEAQVSALEALKMTEQVGDKVYKKDAYEVLVEINRATKNFEAALHYQDQYLALQDSIYNEKTSKDISYLTKSFQEEQDRSHIALLKQQQKTIYIVIAMVALGLIVSSIFSVFLLRSNKSLNRTQVELQDSLEVIEKKNEDIEASIRYASRIQNALLPDFEDFNKALPQNFVFYRPRNVVGGDFYFFREVGNRLFLAVADCTGHGVPGALLSIVGSMALHKMIVDKQIAQAHTILESVHTDMRNFLRQSKENSGMEIALCVIDKEKNTLEIASARNPVYIFLEKELVVVEGDRVMLGDAKQEIITLSLHSYDLKDIKAFYLSSDGLQDQFSSHTNKKLTKKGLRSLLQQIVDKPIQQQAMIVEQTLVEWQGTESQTDDILVMGIKNIDFQPALYRLHEPAE
jgi:serine phosphatase RsbU (regulator of sigma subunit)